MSTMLLAQCLPCCWHNVYHLVGTISTKLLPVRLLTAAIKQDASAQMTVPATIAKTQPLALSRVVMFIQQRLHSRVGLARLKVRKFQKQKQKQKQKKRKDYAFSFDSAISLMTNQVLYRAAQGPKGAYAVRSQWCCRQRVGHIPSKVPVTLLAMCLCAVCNTHRQFCL